VKRSQIENDLMLFRNIASRNALIANYDALATGAAILASFYLRFDGAPFSECCRTSSCSAWLFAIFSI
jgi:hypothetical protein